MKKLFILLSAMAFMPCAMADNGLNTISVVNDSGYKLLLSIVEKEPNGSLLTYHRTLEPKASGVDNEYDYFRGARDRVVGLSVARYGSWYGVGAKPKIIPEADLVKYPGKDITIKVDYSATQQISKKLWGMIGYEEAGGTQIKVETGDFDRWYKYPQFSSMFGWLTAGTDWFTNLVDYLPGARNYSILRDIEKVPASRILGVPQKFTNNDIIAAYIALMTKWNPERFNDKNQKIFAWRMVELIDQAYKSITGSSGRSLLRKPIERPQLQEVEKPIVYNFLAQSQEPKEDLPELDDAALNAAAAETARKLAELFKTK
jgi:hypothetical protein